MRVRRIGLAIPLFAAALLADGQATVLNAGKGWRYQGKLATRGLLPPAADPGKPEADPRKETVLSAGDDAGELLLECPRGLVKYTCDRACHGVPACIDQHGAAAAVKVSEISVGPRALWKASILPQSGPLYSPSATHGKLRTSSSLCGLNSGHELRRSLRFSSGSFADRGRTGTNQPRSSRYRSSSL